VQRSARLRSGGKLVFTVEALKPDDTAPYRLLAHGRYAHGRGYLEAHARGGRVRCAAHRRRGAARRSRQAGRRLARAGDTRWLTCPSPDTAAPRAGSRRCWSLALASPGSRPRRSRRRVPRHRCCSPTRWRAPARRCSTRPLARLGDEPRALVIDPLIDANNRRADAGQRRHGREARGDGALAHYVDWVGAAADARVARGAAAAADRHSHAGQRRAQGPIRRRTRSGSG